MYFVIYAKDKADALEARMANREAHLAYVRGLDYVKAGGAMKDETGKMIGSMLVIERPDWESAQSFVANDPYQINGVFESVDIKEFGWTIGAPA